RMISEYGGIAKVMPIYAMFFLVITMSSIGLPTLNGFIGEFLILIGAFAHNWLWALFAASGIVLGAAYMLWMYQRVFFGELSNEKNKSLKDLNLREQWTIIPLIILAFWIGLYPKPFLDRMAPTVDRVLERVAAAAPEAGQPLAAPVADHHEQHDEAATEHGE
ncbi:MAG: Fe-S-binding domain-containing protein, partial [Acidobacteria bacterium]